MNEEALVTQQTLHWIRSFVVEYNICPFAKQVVHQGSLVIQVIHRTESEAMLDALRQALCLLDEDARTETILMVFPSSLPDFFDYLDFADRAEQFLHALGYEGVYQVATFHPQYCFADVDFDDVSNYTNRSPYPMLHLLREASLDKAIAFYGDTDQIPENNIATLRQLGLNKVKHLLRGIIEQ